MSSRYREVYAAWKADPEAFWAEAAREIDWYKPWDKVFDPYAGQYGRWFVGAECNTAWNCLDRHVERGRGAAEGADLRQPRHQHDARLHLRRAARRGGDARRRAAGPGRQAGRPRDHLHADDAGGGHRACWPARASAPFTRWCSAALPRRSWRRASTTPSRRPSCRPRAASSRGRIVAYKPLLDAPSTSSRHKPQPVVDAAAADGRGDHDAGSRPRLGRRDRRRQSGAGARPAASR